MEQLRDLMYAVLFRVSGNDVTPMSLVIFGVTLLVASVIGQISRRTVNAFFVRKGGQHQEGVAYAFGRISQYIILGVGFLVALETVGFSLASLAALGAVLAVGIGFGLQNIAQNFASGIILLIERPVQKGDFIDVGSTSGVVEDIAMRATRILTRDGVQIIVPNSELVSSRVVNWSAPTPRARARVSVGVAYGSDLNLVRETLLGVAKANKDVLNDPEAAVQFRDFGESWLEFDLCIWIDTPHRQSTITSDIRFAIDAAFRTAGIVIPIPQREVRVRQL